MSYIIFWDQRYDEESWEEYTTLAEALVAARARVSCTDNPVRIARVTHQLESVQPPREVTVTVLAHE